MAIENLNKPANEKNEGEGCTKCGAEFDYENVVDSSENDRFVIFKCFECGFVEECEFTEKQDRVSANIVAEMEFC